MYNPMLCINADGVNLVCLCPQQQSHEKHDVVRRAGDQRACSENLQEPGAESAAGGVCGCEATHVTSLNNEEMCCVATFVAE